MNSDLHNASITPRREFLSRVPLAMAGAGWVLGTASGVEKPRVKAGAAEALLPTIRLGGHEVTRLVAGWNPIGGYSYLGPIMDQQMREYFTPERIVEFLSDCERTGINTHQFSNPAKMAGVIRTLRTRGSKLNFICLHSGGSRNASPQEVVRDTQPIAIVHHGGATDKLFREGKSAEVHDFVKRVHDAGVLAGVSAHNPDCIKRVADEGWDVDFFMTCFYFLTRTQADLDKMPTVATLQIDYPFFASDPATMTEVVRQVDKPCLGFKILAAGRRCHDARTVREAFQFAFEHIKPTDGVIVGMYPRYQDQIRENADHVRKFGLVQTT